MADKSNGQTAPQKKMSKMEAVRKALAHFGKKAKPAEMQPWIKQQFGLDMSTDHISTYKGDILRKKAAKKKAAAAKSAAPERQSRPATKLEAVERALADLGKDAKPLALKKHVKEKFGIDLSPDVARNYKKVLAKRAQASLVTAQQTPAVAGKPGTADVISITDIQAVKELVERVGADPLRRLIDLFGG